MNEILKTKKVIQGLLLILLSLYALNAIGSMDVFCNIYGDRRYTNALWVLLGLYLIVNRGRTNWKFLWEEGWFFVPLILVYLFLYFYHSGHMTLSYVKYGFLVSVSVASVCELKWLNLKTLFLTNSISCVLIFLASLYEIECLRYQVPNGDINQNVFALMALIIGNVSIFSFLYKEFPHSYRIIFFFTGILSVWVALRTSCRTAYFTEIFLIILFLYCAFQRFNWSLKKSIVFFAICTTLLVAVIFTSPSITAYKFNLVSEEVRDFFTLEAGESTNTSIGLRLAMWKTALFELFPQHLFLGVGDIHQLNWNDLHVMTSMDSKFAEDLWHFHNDAINIIVTGGGYCSWHAFGYYLDCLFPLKVPLFCFAFLLARWLMA